MAKSYPDIGTFTSGQILTAATMNDVGTNLDNLRSPPICILAKSISITNAGVTWDFPLAGDEEVDTDGMHSIVTNTTRITPTTAGVYLVTASVGSGQGLYSTSLTIRKNGTDIAQQSNDNGTYNTAPSASTMTTMNGSTDYFDVVMKSTTTATYACRFGVSWLGQTS